MTCDPDYLVLGISALSVWGGTLQSVEDLKQRMKDRAGRDIGVSTAVDGVREALKLFAHHCVRGIRLDRRCDAAERRRRIVQPVLLQLGDPGEHAHERTVVAQVFELNLEVLHELGPIARPAQL